jgi:multicomponent Na+:H+ antiporter subunit D
MTPDAWLPLLVVVSSFIPGLAIFFLAESSQRTRTCLNLLGASLKIVLVVLLLHSVAKGNHHEFRFGLVEPWQFVLKADALALLFVSLSAVLWLLTTVYAIGYLEGSPNRGRFFGFFSVCVSTTTGIAFAGNLFTFLVFYEMLTLSTYPLVVHRGTPAAIAAGRKYLAYTLAGGVLLLVGTVWLQQVAGALDFVQGGFLGAIGSESRGTLIAIFWVLIAGLAVKAALVPFHGWLPSAMVAPAPVSALLHAVAVVKAGAFGIVRIVYDVYGITCAHSLSVLTPLAIVASITILYGSIRALYQDDLKRRLAFSTVSQVSYIALGASLFGPVATTGGIVHLVHQGLMKITLFFCAGNYAEGTGVHKISELNGIGRRMPLTTIAFTIGALGMIGVPPIAGFVSKWYLGLGALEAGAGWVLPVLLGSSALNAAYFLPIGYAAWFRQPNGPWPHDHPHPRYEIALSLLIPPLITALAALIAGLAAYGAVSPLRWVQIIVEREYTP